MQVLDQGLPSGAVRVQAVGARHLRATGVRRHLELGAHLLEGSEEPLPQQAAVRGGCGLETGTGVLIDRNARKGKAPSDHAPVIVDLDWDGQDQARAGAS